MPPKAKIAAPIDRPLSRAYLREFTGWGTTHAPGLSDPTSLRKMENVLIGRDGSARVRPALRSVFRDSVWLLTTPIVGSFEHFFLNDGRKALLFAVRELDQTVGFRVAVYHEADRCYDVVTLDHGDVAFAASELTPFTSATRYVRYLQIDNKIFALSDAGETLRIFHVGSVKKARTLTSIEVPEWSEAHALTIVHPDAAWVNGAKVTVPAAETKTAETLISSTAADNTYSYAYFYTFTNEVGESAPSQMQPIRAQRRWTGWKLETPNGAGEPSGTTTSDPRQAADQLVASMPESVYIQAIDEGAIAWNLYMLTWSDQDNVPVDAILVGTKEFGDDTTWQKDGWIAHTAATQTFDFVAPLPREATRINYSNPSRASQGVVASDRMVLVNDKTDAAVIRWTGNNVGDYTNFSSSKGGGYKTLTSGNMFIPACVKLWQNPQSVDTLTVLCMGVDGYSTAYYMAPADINSQTDSTAVMGFEETTATPGTVSPYGVEVFNNALYHPLDDQLMKSTASNYNINHKDLSAPISNKWRELVQKQQIVSSQHDGMLYFIVYNPDGEPLETGCMGNEIWCYDAVNGEKGVWSRFLIQAASLKKLAIDNKLHMAVVKPAAIMVLDELHHLDEHPAPGGASTVEKGIPWLLETNTQGANRAHDAWAHLQQVSITLGNFQGDMRYGIRSWDRHGKKVDIRKQYRQPNFVDWSTRPLPFDHEDLLQINKDIREWFFFAHSVTDQASGEVLPSYGQISLVQYRYTPVSVNVGGEYGSVETFEYGHAGDHWLNRDSINGIPIPVLDPRRP